MPTKSNNVAQAIRAVIFDYGQVLVRQPTAEEFSRTASVLNLSLEQFYPLWEASRDSYDRGDLTGEQYWSRFAEQAKASIDRQQIKLLRQLEIDVWTFFDPAMVRWVDDLNAAGIKTGVLSNMPMDLITHLRTNRWMDTFTFKTFSAEVRLIKPDPAIYEHTLKGLGVAATESLFLDDREANIRSARSLGMHAIQFRTVAQLRDDLSSLDFPLLPAL